MTDIVSPTTRSRMMSAIRGKNTKPEILLRSLLFRAGFRFRLHRNDLAGKPDIVLPKWKAVVFVHGCFWHRHDGCQLTSTPKTRRAFWKKKFDDTIARDSRNQAELMSIGWRIAVVWECALRYEPEEATTTLVDWLTTDQDLFLEYPKDPF